MHYGIRSDKAKYISSNILPLRTSTLSVKYLRENEYHFSVVVSKKQGKASERNRVKRIIREIFRINSFYFPDGSYMVYYNKKCSDLLRSRILADLETISKKINSTIIGGTREC